MVLDPPHLSARPAEARLDLVADEDAAELPDDSDGDLEVLEGRRDESADSLDRLGEEPGDAARRRRSDELLDVFRNMRQHNIDVLTVGQYLRPSKKHAEVVRYYRPEEFVRLKEQALAMGFGHVEAGPLVRSSYHADEQVPAHKSLLAG